MFVQPDLARTLTRIAEHGPAGFYEGETARLIEQDMAAHGGLITRGGPEGLHARAPDAAARHVPRRGDPLDAADQLRRNGAHPDAQRARRLRPRGERLGIGGRTRTSWSRPCGGRTPTARAISATPRSTRRCRSRRLISKEYAATLRTGIRPDRASVSSPSSFEWPPESDQTTHLSVVDADRNAVAHDVHARGRLRLQDRGVRRGLPAEQRDGRLQCRPRADRRGRADRDGAEPGGAGQAHVVEHDADHRRQETGSC